MPFLRMQWCLSLGLTNVLQFAGPNQINADDDDLAVCFAVRTYTSYIRSTFSFSHLGLGGFTVNMSNT